MTYLPPTHIGVHVADADTADALALSCAASGLIMGVDKHGTAVTVTLFRPEPTVVVAVGGLRLAQLVGFRALAVGAQVQVQTNRPAAWLAFARESGLMWDLGESPHDESRPPTLPVATTLPSGSSDQPQLLLVDSGGNAVQADTPRVGRWSSVVSIVSQLSSGDGPALARADLTLMQRLTAAEASFVCPLLNVAGHEETLTGLGDDDLALIAHGELRMARVAQTMIERRLIGPISPSAEHMWSRSDL